ncbi:MAG TPA: hypothetical protein VLA77_02705 [Candidatus Saccharimonadales bacterium]|nr:hypothetical protein [Candidatus Saccharimonadales bacterium]
MVKSTPAPKLNNSRYIFVTYVYALLLIGFSLFSLVGFGGFDFAGIAFEVSGQPFWIFSLVLAQIFTLPFILRLNLSPLARCISAYLCLLTPLLFLIYVAFGWINFFGFADYLFGLGMLFLAAASFLELNGQQVIAKKL